MKLDWLFYYDPSLNEEKLIWLDMQASFAKIGNNLDQAITAIGDSFSKYADSMSNGGSVSKVILKPSGVGMALKAGDVIHLNGKVAGIAADRSGLTELSKSSWQHDRH